jgi:hypothetical protein
VSVQTVTVPGASMLRGGSGKKLILGPLGLRF